MFNNPNYLPLHMRQEEADEVMAEAQSLMADALGLDDRNEQTYMDRLNLGFAN